MSVGHRSPAGRRWWHEIAVALFCLAAAIVMTWPLASVFGTRFCGGLGDPQLTLWSMRWMRDALFSLQNPFFTPRLYYPLGTTLVFHTFDVPSTLLVVPLWGLVPEVAIYNTAVLVAFALTVYGMARLARELTGDELGGVLAGMLFAGVPYHYAHLQGHLHLISMGWVPLYVVHLVRVVDDRSRSRDALLGGLFLALASLASWYHFVFAAVITVPLVLAGGWRRHGLAGAQRLLGRSVGLGAVWLVVAGPLLVAMILTRQREPILGAHDAVQFSADAASFFDPSGRLPGDGEHATYAGFMVTALALFGAAVDRRARRFLVIAVVGALLALGPVLQWRGEMFGWPMPYRTLERLVPGLDFSGMPVRFGYVLYFGLVVAAAFGLAGLRRRIPFAPLGGAVVVLATLVGLREYRSGPVTTSECPVPPPIRTWAADQGSWAVLDVSGGWSQMWHATLHRKPIVGGYVGRVPQRVEDWIAYQPVLAAIALPDGRKLLSRVDPQIDFVRDRNRDDGLIGDRFSAEWSGSLIAPAEGLYTFQLSTTVDAVVELGQETVLRVFPSVGVQSGERQEGSDRRRLVAGPHAFRLRVFDAPRDAEITLRWAPPSADLEVIPERAFRTAAGGSGLDAEYKQHIPVLSGLGRTPGREALRQWSIRYVVTADVDNVCVEQELDLPEIYRGEGVRIYEVPSRDVG